MCCCGSRGHHGGSSCGCGGSWHASLCVATKEEKVALLEQCLEELRGETQVIEERIAKLRQEE